MKQQSTIIIAPLNIKNSLWNRLKTSVWNFILPPQIRLDMPTKKEKTGE